MLATYGLTRQSGIPNTLFYDYLSPFVMASAVCAFNVLYGLGTKAGEYAGPLKKLSACTLGVYCLHIFVLNERSEEHTSELQSLMRISYAVFCLKKKTKYRFNSHYQNILQAIYNT